jgi:two-component system, response regulator PdtaR
MGHADSHAVTILLIEDEALIRMATAAMLEDAGYCVLEGQDADAALEALCAHPEIDIVITDVQMPGKIDGLKLAQIIGQDYPRIQTVVTSGRASLSEARQCGAKKFLPKPYTADAIQSVVQAVIKHR